MSAERTESPRTVVITGGTNGIGLACAEHFVAQGDRVVVLARNQSRLDSVAERLGVEAHSVDASEVASLEAIRSTIGNIDVLVHAAGVLRARRFRKQTLADFEDVIRANLTVAYATAWSLLPAMKQGARIIFISSASAVDRGIPFISAYSASKAAVRSLAATLRAELEPDGIAVHAVFPDTVDTDMMAVTEVERAALLPEDVASAVAWLDGLDPRVRVDEIVLRPVSDSPFAHVITPKSQGTHRD